MALLILNKSSQSYRMSLAIWDQTVLHNLTHPAVTLPDRLVLDLPTPEGWIKAELI